jgi:FlaA1/EpsC-like NDP-sugar epimerase
VSQYDIDEIVIAMPRAPGRIVRRVVKAALQAGAKTRTIPGMYDILSGRVTVASLREVEIQDLLRRDPIQTDLQQVRSLATGETVLVTGAGGSIGSELCRQLARLEPAQILLLGHGENSIFDIELELAEAYPNLTLVPLIADVRDRERMRRVIQQYQPYAVFHAAAHKHVPLMEGNLAEAITNNVLGTRNVAELSAELGVEHLVLISTDKAVRPTNVMGATKRVAEQIVQDIAESHRRNFVAVRFGNVLGSRGSVVPTFLRQIQSGGPVTVTHPEMRRYFMTIPEAVQLVLQAGAIGKGGEVFVLNMGEPVKILDLATDLIRLSGLEVGTDIEIRFTGTRPGEKLYEELFFSSENAYPTDHPKVLRAKNGSLPPGLASVIDVLIDGAHRGWSDEALRALLVKLVPDFSPQTEGSRRDGVAEVARI